MTTTAGIFQFDQGTSFANTPGIFTEHGVQFTLSTFDPTGSSSFSYNPGNSANTGSISVFEFGGTPDVALTLAINNSGGFSKFTGSFTITAGDSVAGTWLVSHNSLIVGSFTAPSQKIIVTAAESGGSAIKFIHTGGSVKFLNIDSMTATVNCYLTGTSIATPDGAVAVETLQPGMRILTADGGETTVKWLGRQDIDARFSHPARVNPVCITAGALADGVPARDLYVTPDHAVAIDGMLINASSLVNGQSIYQLAKMPLDGFSYYHVETDAHELLLAEGCAAESYLDIPDRSAFVNGAERDGVPPIAEMDLPRISTPRLVPQAIRARLMARSGVRDAA